MKSAQNGGVLVNEAVDEELLRYLTEIYIREQIPIPGDVQQLFGTTLQELLA